MQFATFGLTKRTAGAVGVLVFLCASMFAQGFSFISPSRDAAAPAADSIVVMPFENRSQMAKYNWICDSFAILIGDVIDAHGIRVVNIDMRNQAFEKMHLSPSDLLTRAAMIRVAGAARANLALVGEFDIGESKDDVTISIVARLIETNEGRLAPAKTFNYSGSLSNLQDWQGQLAWNIIYERNPSMPYSKEQIVNRAKRVPPAAYESFVKGVQTRDLKLRESFLLRCIQECENSGEAIHFPEAIYELGLLYYRQDDFAEAAKTLKRMFKDDPTYAKSLFYLGLATYKAGDVNEASSAFESLIELVPIPEVVNDAGVALLAKGENEKALQFLRRAVDNSPNDMLYRFNLGYALWRAQKFAEASQSLRAVAQADPRDGEAQFILAKSLESAGQQAEAARADNEAKRYLSNYARWAVAPERIPVLARLKEELNQAGVNKMEGQWQIKVK
ncbi:MAG: tetratricopeptide repeat protein [Chloracidobacterium sp.]|nr:tetratricopeptide repeat protein [Chloracidobacterium sp.]